MIFGVYRFMSIAIATTNAIGNSVATVVTAKICGEFDEAMSREAYARVQRGEDILQPLPSIMIRGSQSRAAGTPILTVPPREAAMNLRAIRMIFIASLAAFVPGLASAQEAEIPGQSWPSTLTIGTASPGGTYYSYGEGLAQILTRELGRPVSVKATQGPGENITLLETGEIQIAFVTLGAAQQAWNATGPYGGQPARIMRALFPMYDTAFQFAVPDEFLHLLGGRSRGQEDLASAQARGPVAPICRRSSRR